MSDVYEIEDIGRGTPFFEGGRQANPIETATTTLLSGEVPRFQHFLEEALRPQARYLTETELGIYQRGKKIRPHLLMLSAKLIAPDAPCSDKVIKASVSLEMLHVASLIHDDIIDDALLRRGLQSVNASRGTNAAILVGDLQFLQAIRNFLSAIETEHEMHLVGSVLDAAFNICTGELDEIATEPHWDTETLIKRYFSVIERKTAIMFGLACETGIALVDGRSSDARRLGFYGRRIGRAFQVMDDILDFMQSDEAAGKRAGIDLEMRRLTLPIIFAMDALGPDHVVTKHIHGDSDELDISQALDAVRETDAIPRSYAMARESALEALDYLEPFPRSPAHDILSDLAMYIVDREF
ncbi:polyprenyl synthetase family protein [Gymnodinialimonas sp.]